MKFQKSKLSIFQPLQNGRRDKNKNSSPLDQTQPNFVYIICGPQKTRNTKTNFEYFVDFSGYRINYTTCWRESLNAGLHPKKKENIILKFTFCKNYLNQLFILCSYIIISFPRNLLLKIILL